MLVQKDTLVPWSGEPIAVVQDEAMVHYFDGRGERIKVTPYSMEVRHPQNIESTWTAEELAAVGLVRVEPFVVPDGKVRIGSPRVERDGDKVREVYDVVDNIPMVTIPRADYEDLLSAKAKVNEIVAAVDALKE